MADRSRADARSRPRSASSAHSPHSAAGRARGRILLALPRHHRVGCSGDLRGQWYMIRSWFVGWSSAFWRHYNRSPAEGGTPGAGVPPLRGLRWIPAFGRLYEHSPRLKPELQRGQSQPRPASSIPAPTPSLQPPSGDGEQLLHQALLVRLERGELVGFGGDPASRAERQSAIRCCSAGAGHLTGMRSNSLCTAQIRSSVSPS